VQEEIATVIESTGISLNKTQNNQLLAVIRNLFQTYTDTEIDALTAAMTTALASEASARATADVSEASTRAGAISGLLLKIGAVGVTDLQTQIDQLLSLCANLQAQIDSFTSSNWTAQQIVNLIYPVGTAIVTNTSGSGAPQQPANQLQAYGYAVWNGVARTYEMDPWIMVRSS
jgi:hypothetical protein